MHYGYSGISRETNLLSEEIDFYTVKLANSTSPFKFRQVKFPQKKVKKLVLRLVKCVFLKEKLDPIDTVYEKHILSFSRPACRGILTWWNLKGLAELANLTVLT